MLILTSGNTELAGRYCLKWQFVFTTGEDITNYIVNDKCEARWGLGKRAAIVFFLINLQAAGK